MERISTETIKVNYSEMDCKFVLKPAALLNFLQDLATINAEKLGFGYSYTSKNNLAWFLLKYRMEFIDYPEKVYDLKIMTEPRGYQKHFAHRDFTLYEGDKLLGRATSTWSLVDINNKSLVSIASLNNESMPVLEKRDDDLCHQKIKPLEKTDIKKEFEIRYDDIDVNCHVNNANYIVWAFEPLSFEFRNSYKLKTLDMLYKKEIKYGEKVISEIEFKDEKTTVHVIKNANTGEELCLVQAEWI